SLLFLPSRTFPLCPRRRSCPPAADSSPSSSVSVTVDGSTSVCVPDAALNAEESHPRLSSTSLTRALSGGAKTRPEPRIRFEQ
uniref:Uncharacterized protein n=1 Tax=Cucumis melo TaxID=3656 RepID=A0A9I9E3Q4_CUCME